MTETTPANAMPVFRVQGSLAPDLARDCVRLEIAEGTEGLRTLQAHVVTDDPPQAGQIGTWTAGSSISARASRSASGRTSSSGRSSTARSPASRPSSATAAPRW